MGGGCGAPIRRGAWCCRDQCPGTAGAGVPKAACALAHDAHGSRGSHGRTARSRPPGLLLPGAAGHMRGPSGRERGRRSLEGSQHQAQRPPGFFGPRNGATPSQGAAGAAEPEGPTRTAALSPGSGSGTPQQLQGCTKLRDTSRGADMESRGRSWRRGGSSRGNLRRKRLGSTGLREMGQLSLEKRSHRPLQLPEEW